MNRPIDICCQTKKSLVHIGSLDSFDLTPGGIEAATCILKYFETQDNSFLLEAVHIYDEIIPTENFGGEYTALRWICLLLLAPSPELVEHFRSVSIVESWYHYLQFNDFEKLKTYLNHKYHFVDIAADDTESKRILRFLEDFILFSNPDRERWEKTAQMLEQLRLYENLTIADVGCGSGYFTFKFADIVGQNGKVYGIEINPLHLDYLHRYMEKHQIGNVEIVTSSLIGIGLDPSVKVDVVFSCSLFHILYAAFSEQERHQFLQSIHNALRPGGTLIVVDNELVNDDELPYHGPYISKELLISQLYYYGFKLVKTVQPTVQRYALIFERCETVALEDRTDLEQCVISALSGASLVKYALADAAPTAVYTESGKNAAALLLQALNDKNPNNVDSAIDAYEQIIPTERIGNEYTALIWFCELLKASPQRREQLLVDPLVRDFYDDFVDDDYALLKKFLIHKYELQPIPDDRLDNLIQLSEYICFNNPNRDRWEQTDQMLACLDIKPGEVIADVGCGSGFFTYRFARLTGPAGLVYATEINKGALSYVETMRDRHLPNIVPTVSALNDARLPFGRFDKIFLCSMYHAVYVASIEYVKDSFIASIQNALKDDGRLIIVDNEISRAGVPEYYGSGIDRRLVICQLRAYGFELVDERQFIPQRYVLIFKKKGNYGKRAIG